MSDAAPTAAPAASTPAPSAPVPTLRNDSAGPQSPSRDANGRFASATPPEPKPVDDDPEYDLGDGVKLKRSALKSELGRARQSSKVLTEAQKRAERAEQLEKAQQERRQKYRDDPESFFADLEMDPDAAANWASKYIHEKHIRPSEMTAEQRALEDAQKKLAAYEAKEKQAADEAKQAEQQRFVQEETAKLKKQVAEYINAGKLPNSALVVKRIAERIEAYENKNIHIDVAQAAQLIRDDVASETAEVLTTASVDDLRELWGPEKFKAVAQKFLNWSLSQIRQPGLTQRTQPAPQPKPQSDNYLTPAEYALRQGR